MVIVRTKGGQTRYFMSTQETALVQFSVRIPKELDDAIQLEAQQEKRSKNNQVAVILERHFNQKRSDVTADSEQIALSK